jgi:hypothetical protein
MTLNTWIICRCALLATALLASTATQAQPAPCDRACLTGYVDAYFTALKAHSAQALPQASSARITENGAEKKLAETFWPGAQDAVYRFDIVNTRVSATGTEAVIRNADGSKTILMLRLKLRSGAITEIETIRANKGDAGSRLWDPDQLRTVSPSLLLSIREPARDSYYDLIGTTESYWRAFQTQGTPNYRRARLLTDALRVENGWHAAGVVRDGKFVDAARGFDDGTFVGRNVWDRRYPVVDEERGIVLSIVRLGLKAGAKSDFLSSANDLLVGEFFAIQNGQIREIQSVLYGMPDAKPTGWPADYGPGPGSTE